MQGSTGYDATATVLLKATSQTHETFLRFMSVYHVYRVHFEYAY